MTSLQQWSLAVVCALTTVACGNNTPTTPTTPEIVSPLTTTFASRVTVGGSAARAFATQQAGTVTVQLKSAGSPSAVLGLGIGLPYGGVSTCTLTRALTTSPADAPQITATVEEGAYCVAVYDVGNLTAPMDFEVVVVYP